MKLSRHELGQLYIAVVAAATGRLMGSKLHREKDQATAHAAHERGLLAVQEARLAPKSRRSLADEAQAKRK